MKHTLLLLCASALWAQVAPPASATFDKDAVHEIRVTFKQTDWFEQLTRIYAANPDNTPYLEASLVWGQYKFDSVGIRFKGNSSYSGATTRKKPFRIKLNEFVKGQKIEKMASFGLSNFWSDPSYVREKSYYELAQKAGLTAARSNFAALYVNDEYLGVYALGEVVNGDFLDNHFAKPDLEGNLYKASQPGANLAYAGEDPKSYQTTFSKESNEEADDWTDLIELARTFEQTPTAELKAKLDKLIDVDSFLTALALDNLTVNTDSYVGMAQNYYLYRRTSDKKWVWIPWDPSLAFGALGQGSSVDLPLEWTQDTATGGFGGGFGGGAGGRPLATKLWSVPEYKQRYRQIYQRLVDEVLIPAQLITRMDIMRTLIRPSVDKETQRLVTMAQFDAAMKTTATTTPGNPGIIGNAPALEPFIQSRMISVKAQLAGRASPVLSATPASLVFAQVAGASTAGAQDLALALPAGSLATNFTAATTTPWLSLSGATGALPASVGVRVTAPSLAAGTQTGAINITAAGTTNSPLSVPVTLIVAAAPSIVASPTTITLGGGGIPTDGGGLPGGGGGGFPGGGGIPGGGGGGFPGGGGGGFPGGATAQSQTLTVLSTAGASPFTVTITESTCTNFLTATPSSGTTPATVTVTSSATATGPCTAKVNIASAGLATASIPVTLQQTTLPGGGGFGGLPTVTAIVNSASYTAGALAPGTVVTLFGTNLGAATLATGTFANGQWSTTSGGLQFTFDGTPAPILYTRSDQAAVVVPFEVAGKSQVAVSVALGGFGGFPGGGIPNLPGAAGFQMNVATASPGIYTTDASGKGQAAVINQAGTLNGASAPAPRGSTVALYLTGAGALNPAGKSGALGTATQRTVADVKVTIGGVDAQVAYAGAAPGSIQGLYQVNAVIPAGVTPGAVPLQVTVGGVASQAGVTMSVQ